MKTYSTSLPVLTCLALLVACVFVVPGSATAQQAPPPGHPTTPPPAEEAAPESHPHRLQLGVNLRTDMGVHAVRADVGWSRGELGTLLVLDPMFWTDGQTSTDLTAHWLRDGFQPFAGWRMTSVPVLDSTQLQQNLLVGVGLPFPSFYDGWLTGQWGLEMATTVVKHSGGLPSESISFESGRHYIDFVNFAMYARFDFNWEFD